jgi:rhodanese-related sulfurtransferase
MGQLAEFAGNHPFLVGGLVVSWLAVVFYEMRMRAQGARNVSTADAVRLINKGALVIDVRKPEAFQAGHIVNARNVEFAKLASGEDPIGKQKNKVLVTVCDNGLVAGKAAALLRKAGYEHVFSLKGGIAGWRADNLPLVKS